MNQRFTKINIKGIILPDDAQAWSIIRDDKSDLWWQQETAGPMDWDKAKAYCESLNHLEKNGFGGQKGWRLPTQNELLTLIDNRFSPAIDISFFPKTCSSAYWTSTGNTFFPENQCARIVSFSDGLTTGCLKWNHCYVRAVRGGKP